MFDATYEAFVADTPEARRIHHRIRYTVYCLERGFEDPQAFPEGEERDQWDDRSVPFIFRHRHTGAWVGALRLVTPGPEGLPLQQMAETEPMHRETAWELSRICVPGGMQGPEVPVANAGGQMLRDARSPDLFAGMLRAAIEYTRDQDVPYLYFLANRALARIVGRLGFAFQNVGPGCDHRGMRYPYRAHLDEAVLSAVQRSSRMERLFYSPAPAYRLHSERLPGNASPMSPMAEVCRAA
ncbi:MAG: PEP-CTERM/exosortase system-associated acyltransferase [Ectothiorhodospira sp.]